MVNGFVLKLIIKLDDWWMLYMIEYIIFGVRNVWAMHWLC